MAAITQAVAEAPGITLEDARFIDLVTFRRTGEAVGTPVLFVQDGDRLRLRTAAGTGKLKRLAHTASVEVAPADSHGRHLGATLSGTARVLGDDAIAPTLAAIHAKHRIAGPIATFIRHRRGERDVIVEVTLDPVP
jgi:uncharacterized protein